MPIARPTQTIRHTAVVLAGAASLTLTVVAGSYIVHQLPNAAEADNHIIDFSAPPAPIQREDRAVDSATAHQRVLPISPAAATQGENKTGFTPAFNSTGRWQSTASSAGVGPQQHGHDSADRTVGVVSGVAIPVPASTPAPGAAEPPNTFQLPDMALAVDTPDQSGFDGAPSVPDEPDPTPEGYAQGGRWDLGPGYLDARTTPNGDDTVALTVGTNGTNLHNDPNNAPATELQGRMDTEDPAASVRFSDPALGEHGVEFGNHPDDGNTAVPADNATDDTVPQDLAARADTAPAESTAEQPEPVVTEDGTNTGDDRQHAPAQVIPDSLSA